MNRLLISLIYTCTLAVGFCSGVNNGADQVAKAMEEFVTTQENISECRKALSDKLQLLEKKVSRLKHEIKERSKLLADMQQDEKALQRRGEEVKTTLKDIEHLTRQHLDQGEKVDLATLLSQSSSNLDALVASHLKSMEVYDESGNVFFGKALSIGPAVYWQGEDGRCGVVIEERNIPLLKEFVGERKNAVATLFAGNTAELPVYFDSKMAFAEVEEGFVDHLKKGGAAMIPLLLLAVMCLVVAVVRAFALCGVVNSPDEKKIAKIVACLQNDDKGAALTAANELKRPLAQVIKEGIENSHLAKESLEEILYERVTLEIPRLERWLAALAVGATAAPLLGLLGTVTGMISTFKQITVYGTGNASVLSGGISEALITTEAGLIIAVPALIMHAWLARRVSKAVALTQKGAIIFVNELKVRG